MSKRTKGEWQCHRQTCCSGMIVVAFDSINEKIGNLYKKRTPEKSRKSAVKCTEVKF